MTTTQFWPTERQTAAPRRRVRMPPWPVISLLIALLAVILATAGLQVRSRRQTDPITLIVDRGLLTSAVLQKSASLGADIADMLPAEPRVEWVSVPGDAIEPMDRSGAAVRLASLRATAIDTRPLLLRAIRAELARTHQRIVVITALPVEWDDPRVSVVRPEASIENVAIEHFAVRESQAMVRIRNDGAQKSARLRVAESESFIELPPSGTSRDYFVEVGSPGATCRASVLVTDGIRADNEAYLVRSRPWPRLQRGSALPPGVERMMEVYARQRGPSRESPEVVVTTDTSYVGAGVIIAIGGKPMVGEIEVNRDHPLARDVDWSAALAGANLQPAGAGWSPVVSVGGLPVVATRQTPAARVWIGVDPTEFSARPDFVVFLSRAFSEASGGEERYTAQPVHPLGPDGKRVLPESEPEVEWAPGVFRLGEGLVAMNMSVSPAIADRALATPSPEPVPITISAAPGLFLTSLGLSLAGVFGLTRRVHRLG